MPRRFFIVDNALQTMVGHFYEYDVSVKAHLPEGLEGVIVSHLDVPPELRTCTTPFFRCDFWSLSESRRPLKSGDPTALGSLPVADSAPPAVGEVPSASGGAPRPNTLERLKSVGRRLEQRHGSRWWAQAALRAGKPLYYAYRARQWRRDADVPTGQVAATTGLDAPAEPNLNAGDSVLRDVFANDLSDLLVEHRVAPTDVLFFPNMNHWTLAAVVDLLQRHPSPKDLPEMKLLFRRNVFRGPATTAQYLADDYMVHLLRDLFAKLETLDVSRCEFFTDTRRLKYEYEVFSPFVFRVLPIPFRHDYIRLKPRPGRPLRIVYLGNARSEKGFQHIPALVERMRDRIARREVEFVLQAVPDPEPVIVSTLGALKRGGLVTLLEQPLTDREYYDLINGADILLIPYDPIQYYSRSSCIFVESMVSGTPFLTLAGSWMADTMTPGTGEAAASIEELPDGLERLVGDYPSYFEACQRASREWREFHNAGRLVEILLSDVDAAPSPP